MSRLPVWQRVAQVLARRAWNTAVLKSSCDAV